MKEIQISLKHLHATSMAASKETVRFYLNGVYIKPSLTGNIYVATDGNMMIKTEQTCEPVDFQPFIIPLDTIKQVIKLFKGLEDAILVIDGDKYKIVGNGASIGFVPKNGNFPDYERIFPNISYGDKIPSVNFAADLLNRFGKAIKIFEECKEPVLRFSFTDNNNNPTKITCNDGNFSGVIMPIRSN